jgi:sarcosine oxidase subunit alpha
MYLTETSAIGYYADEKTGKHKFLAVQEQADGYQLLEVNADNIVITSGANENYLPFPKNYLPGVYGAGGVQTLMNVYGVKPGNKALIIGAGNVGLIVGYQLLQAGVEVKAVIEAMPHVGGYLVHASKLARLGVSILLRHSIKEAKGEEYVSGATIVEIDEDMQPIEGTERELDVDLILIAVGLSSSTRIPFQAGCEKMFVSQLGGWVPIHNENMETTIEGIYVAGDVSGIAEASTAMLEGRIAGAAIAEKEACNPEVAQRVKEGALTELNKLRESSLLKAIAAGKRKCQQKWSEVKSHEQ